MQKRIFLLFLFLTIFIWNSIGQLGPVEVGNTPLLSESIFTGQDSLDFNCSLSLVEGIDNSCLDGMVELAILAVFNPGTTDQRTLLLQRQNASGNFHSWTIYHEIAIIHHKKIIQYLKNRTKT